MRRESQKVSSVCMKLLYYMTVIREMYKRNVIREFASMMDVSNVSYVKLAASRPAQIFNQLLCLLPVILHLI